MNSTPYRLKASEVATVRTRQLASQANRCGLCRQPLDIKPVLDHDHTTGAVRDTLHNGCNALLGKVENNYKRYGVRNLAAFCNGLADYFARHEVNVTGYLHPTHKTPDEKHERTKLLARKRYAASKAG